jgi:hypothetical protein
MKVRLALVALVTFAAFSLGDRSARAQLSDAERKATARAAYHEGITLQEKGNTADALARFEAAQSVFPAPTHLLRIAQCQALLGKLIEASETYEQLSRATLAPDAPEAFVSAKEKARAELAQLKPRIPSLRITIQPPPSSVRDMRVLVNDAPIPNELIGLARPVNPGRFRITVSAPGYRTANPIDVIVVERESRTAEIMLRAEPSVVLGGTSIPEPRVAPRSTPEAYESTNSPASAPPGPSSAGLLLGLRPLVVVPGGQLEKNRKLSDFASAGGGIGIDAIARFSRMFLIGGTLELARLGTSATTRAKLPANVEPSMSTSYLGVFVGIVPNVDRVTFIADAGLGLRLFTSGIDQTNAQGATASADSTWKGLDFSFNAGLSIPAGRFRIAPKAGFSFGTFTSADCSGNTTACGVVDPTNRETHLFAQLSVGVYYHLDFAKH